ncbi:hypothetical protein, partial [Pseudomonas syringae]
GLLSAQPLSSAPAWMVKMAFKKIVIKTPLYAVYFMCLLTYALLHGSEYDWMEPASIVPSIEDGGSSRSVVRGAAVVIVLVVQLLICIAGSRREALATVVLLGVVLAVYW